MFCHIVGLFHARSMSQRIHQVVQRFLPQLRSRLVFLAALILVIGGVVTPLSAQATPGVASCDTSDSNYSQEMVLEFTPTVSAFTLNLPAQNFTGSIDWGDGSTGLYTGSTPSHGYVGLIPGNTFQVCLLGTATAFGTPADPTVPGYNPWDFHWAGQEQLTAVTQWGSLEEQVDPQRSSAWVPLSTGRHACVL